ncbi:LexA family protein [Phyllobacterium ifriqiyense]|jgi:SOS-response transcriptional repressor LexA|uniref:LexA family protein n=1 Tax=Phyllobacterium ifriqiyense TaxID=314238 RepID=UPI0033910317
MNVAGVTPRQRDLLEAFQSFVNVNGYSPSYIELKEALGFASTSSVARLVDALEERGFLCRHPGKARSIQLAVRP